MSERPTAENDTPMCNAQTYWYENGVQRAVFCDRRATMLLRSLDGSRNHGCDEHGARMMKAGARVIPAAATEGGAQ